MMLQYCSPNRGPAIANITPYQVYNYARCGLVDGLLVVEARNSATRTMLLARRRSPCVVARVHPLPPEPGLLSVTEAKRVAFCRRC